MATNPKLRVFNLLQNNEPVIATFMALPGMRTAQVVANTGLDAVIVDCEHGNIDDSQMHAMVSGIASTNCSPIVRIRGPDQGLIKRGLDTGAHGLLVPQINAAAEARSVVSFSKFPPLGVRGQGGAFHCFEFGYSTPSEYVSKANSVVKIMIQIESREALSNVEEIAQVPGIDLLFIGPNDLALSLLGYTPAKYTEPEFLDAIDKVVATAKRYEKKVGILVKDGAGAKEAKKRFDFVAVGTEVRALQAFYGRELEIARG